MKFKFIEMVFCKCKDEYYFIGYDRRLTHYCCKKCGKIKKFKEVNNEYRKL